MGGARRSCSDRGAPASALLSAGTGTQPGRERGFVLLTWRILLVKISLICSHRGALEEGVRHSFNDPEAIKAAQSVFLWVGSKLDRFVFCI